jgi:hypothetical protein
VSFCDGNSGTNLDILLVYVIIVQPRGQMTQGIHGNDLLGVGPLREGANGCGRLSVSEIGLVINLEVLNCDGKSVVDTIGTTMGANCYLGRRLENWHGVTQNIKRARVTRSRGSRWKQ